MCIEIFCIRIIISMIKICPLFLVVVVVVTYVTLVHLLQSHLTNFKKNLALSLSDGKLNLLKQWVNSLKKGFNEKHTIWMGVLK